jgi:hypothetical protein
MKLSDQQDFYIDELRSHSMKAVFEENKPIIIRSQRKSQISPLRVLVGKYQKESKSKDMTNFADYLSQLYEEVNLYHVPLEHQVLQAFNFIIHASQSSYHRPFATRKNRMQCFLEFLKSQDELKGWSK